MARSTVGVQRRGIRGRPVEDRQRVVRALEQREIDSRGHRNVQAIVVNVGDNADDAGRLPADGDAAADRILARRLRPRERFVDDRDRLAPGDVGIGECAAAEDRRSQRREIVGARHLKLRTANVSGRGRFADECEPLRHARSAERRSIAGAHPGRLDAGQRARPGAAPR